MASTVVAVTVSCRKGNEYTDFCGEGWGVVATDEEASSVIANESVSSSLLSLPSSRDEAGSFRSRAAARIYNRWARLEGMNIYRRNAKKLYVVSPAHPPVQ
jgi:hypothetical protein